MCSSTPDTLKDVRRCDINAQEGVSDLGKRCRVGGGYFSVDEHYMSRLGTVDGSSSFANKARPESDALEFKVEISL